MKRRTFITNSVKQAGAITIAPPFIKNLLTDSPNERVNIAVVGISGYRERIRDMINGRGIDHVKYYSKMPNVRITTLCDVDERLFPGMVSEVEKLAGYTPKTEWDFRKLIEDPDLDAVSIATPDHWHALQTVWACQA